MTVKKNSLIVTPSSKRPKGWGARHTMTMLGFWAMCILYALRFNLSITIVAMVRNEEASSPSNGIIHENDHVTRRNLTGLEETCAHLKERFDPEPKTNFLSNNQTEERSLLARMIVGSRRQSKSLKMKEENEAEANRGEFNWTRGEQGIILGSFFWGHFITQIPGGMLAQRYGAKWPLGLGILLTSILTLVTPMAARFSVNALITVRVLQGLVGGVVYPAMHLVIGKWAPLDERSKLVSIVYAGPQFGTAMATVACGYLIDWNVFGGWPGTFYILGGLSLIWFVFWCFLMYDTPASHPRITAEELAYIEGSIGEQAIDGKKTPTPWKSIMTSVPLWAILVAHVGEDWGLYTLLTELPTYMKTVLHFNIKENSWMSALPQLVRWGFSIVLTYMAEYLVSKGVFRVITARKICNSIAHWGAAIALITVSYLGCDPVMTVIVLTLAVGINGAVNGGCITNHVDIGANHAGILMGVTNTAANLCGIVAPYVAGLLTNESASLDRWQIVFFIAAAVYFFDNLFYIIFASSTEQPWNRPQEKNRLSANNYTNNLETGTKGKYIEDCRDEKINTNPGNVNWIVVSREEIIPNRD